MQKFTLLTLSLLAFSSLSQAQEPPFLSPLLVQPGLGSQKCVQPTGGFSANGTPVVITACTGSTAQQWTFSNNLIKVFGNKCLVVPGGQNQNGVQLQITTCNANDPNQKFYYNFFDYNQVSWMNTNKCIDLSAGSLSNNNPVQIWQCYYQNPNQVWNVGYSADNLPATSEADQSGYNNCGTGQSQSSHCQTAWINDVDDFCLWAPPSVGTIGDTERNEVAWCTKAGRGTRVIPNGTLKGVHFVKTKDYVQVTGVGDFTKINVPNKDEGGELDPHGSDGNGNPIGGLVYGNTFGTALQYHEWTSFIAYNEFCFRACIGPNAAIQCNHIYDIMGCYWNMPADYDAGVFESCDGDDDLPMGVYGTSTWYQGQSPTPSAHPVAPSSNCHRIATVSSGSVGASSTSTKPASTSTKPASTSTSHSTSTTQSSSTTSTASASPTPTGAHRIHPEADANKCLNAVSNSDGANVTIQTCNGSAGQTWVRTGANFKVFGNKCLDVPNGNDVDGQQLQIWTCGTGNTNQKWTITASKTIKWSSHTRCLDLSGGSTANGSRMQIWTCSPVNNNRIWSLD